MKKKKGFMAKAVSLVLALTMALGLCMTSAAANVRTQSESENIVVTFITDGHATVDIYYSKDDYTTPDETNVTSAYVRGKGSTEIDNSGDGQVNFKVNADEGYEYTVTVEPADNYNNCKGEDETGVADIWRVTKITDDITVTITTTEASGSTSGSEDEDEYYTVTFVTDEHVTVDTYYTKDASKNNTDNPDETNVTSAIARESETGEPDVSGTGQVNFRVNADDGYEYTVTAEPESNYKTLKGKDDTGVEDVWRVSKMTGDVTVTITSAAENDVASEIDETTVWSYLDDGTDPAEGYEERTAWTLASYDVSGWNTASGSFGAKNGAIASLGTSGSTDYTPDNLLTQYKEDGSTDIEAYFFRTQVYVEDADAVTQILGNVVYDDAATVYVNGVKIAGFDDDDITENLQYGGSNAGTPKSGDINVTDASVISEAVVTGVNEVAVEIHQGRASSSDIYFAMSYLVFSTDEIVADEQTDISISMGQDETERNFTWYAPVSGSGTLYIAKESDLVNGEMPADAAAYTVEGAAAGKTGYYTYQTIATDLEGGTTYAYQVVNGEIVSDIMTFTTGTEGDFSFAFVGDPQIGAGSVSTDIEGWENTLNIIATEDEFDGVDFMLSAGDQVQTGNDEDLYDGYLNHSALLSLAVATVIGNHDTNATDSTYGEHFNITNESEYGASSAGADYYYIYNNVLFIVLNSNNTSTAEHEAFMRQVIEETADQDFDWKIVTFHHSIYSVASHAVEQAILTRRDELVPIFDELGIDVVLMGHDHVYVRTYIMDGLNEVTDASAYDDDSYSSVTDPDGTLYVTANSASGSKYYAIQTSYDFPYAAVMNQEQVPNVSRVDVTDSSFTITTYRTSDMSVVDTFTINHSQEDSETEADTLAVRRGSLYYFSDSLQSSTADRTAELGAEDDEVIFGDWDGDGVDTICVRSGNTYSFSNTTDSDAAGVVTAFGRSTDEVLVGDWNGDGKDTLAVRRGNVYYFQDSIEDETAGTSAAFGKDTDTALAGDWDGDGKDSLALRRGNVFYVSNTIGSDSVDQTVSFGKSTDEILVGDWDGDGKDTLAARRGNLYYFQADIKADTVSETASYGKASDQVYAGVWK